MQSQLQVYSCCCLAIKSCPALCDPMHRRDSPGPSVLGDFQASMPEVGLCFLLQGSSPPRDRTCLLGLQAVLSPLHPAVTFIQIGISSHRREAPSTVPLCRGEPARSPHCALRMRAVMAHSPGVPSMPLQAGEGVTLLVTVSTLYLTIHTLPPLPSASVDVSIRAQLPHGS